MQEEPKPHSTLIKVMYSLMALWLLGAGIYIGSEMVEQHSIFSDLNGVRAGGDACQKARESLLNRGGKISLLYVLQEIQQDPNQSNLCRAAGALLMAGGARRAPLGENEKAAVRKLVTTARTALADRLEGRGVSFNPAEQRFLEQFIAILDQAEFQKLDKAPAISIFRKIADTAEPGTPDEIAYFRANIDKLLERIDLIIAGTTMEVTPAETALFDDAAQYCTELLLASSPAEKAPGEQASEEQPPAADAAAQPEPTVKEESLKDVFLAVAGLSKMSGAISPVAEPKQAKALGRMLKDGTAPKSLPVDKLATWLLLKPQDDFELPKKIATADKLVEWLQEQKEKTHNDFTAEEKAQMLQTAGDLLAQYEAQRSRLSDVALKLVQQMKQNGRFASYPDVDDPERRQKAGVFSVISDLWKKTDDRVMILDMVGICATRNQHVRENMEKAFVAIGGPAAPNLVRIIQRDKIDEALAAKTDYRTKHERLRELNEDNKTVRISCIKALGQIGGSLAEKAFGPLLDDKDPDIVAAARLAAGSIRMKDER
ncbi:MAG TPA: hypothetical protein VM223_14260 [Planctomycetota bacterium]|nr:hypothetical protein [Planctomycetota bacterium]